MDDTIETIDGYTDSTENIEEYENGKVWVCECGQGIGTEMERELVDCASCERILFDRKADERKPPESENGQSTLGEWA